MKIVKTTKYKDSNNNAKGIILLTEENSKQAYLYHTNNYEKEAKTKEVINLLNKHYKIFILVDGTIEDMETIGSDLSSDGYELCHFVREESVK